MTSTHQITAGFLPLLDSALLVAAKEKGFAAEQEIELTLVRERSWATRHRPTLVQAPPGRPPSTSPSADNVHYVK